MGADRDHVEHVLPTDDFDEHARDYDQVLDTVVAGTGAGRDHFTENRVRWIERLSRRAGGSTARVLDLGCGDGLTEVWFEKVFPSARIIGVDVSGESIKLARERGLERSEFAEFDGDGLPFRDESFDVVIMAGVLHHVPADQARLRLLREARRVLEASGSLYVFEQNPFNPVTRRIVDRCPFDEHARLLTAGQLRVLLEEAGFERPETYYILFSPRHRVFTPIHRIEPALRRVPIGGQYLCVTRRRPSR